MLYANIFFLYCEIDVTTSVIGFDYEIAENTIYTL